MKMTAEQIKYTNTAAKLYASNIKYTLRLLPFCKTTETRHTHMNTLTVQQINIIKNDVIREILQQL
jgi:hypothetical protein